MTQKQFLLNANSQKAAYENEIQQLRNQLLSIEKRIQHLKEGIIIYFCLIVVPPAIIALWVALSEASFFVKLIGTPPAIVLGVLWAAQLIPCIYQLIKSILHYRKSQDAEMVFSPPTLRDSHQEANPERFIEPEESFMAEKKKVEWVLFRYEHILDEIKAYIEAAKEEKLTEPYDVVYEKIQAYPFYRTIRPFSEDKKWQAHHRISHK